MQAGDTFRFTFLVNDAANAPAALDAGASGTARRNGAVDVGVVVALTPLAVGEYEASGTVPTGYAGGDTLSVTVDGTTTTGGATTPFRMVHEWELETLAPLPAGATAVASHEDVTAATAAANAAITAITDAHGDLTDLANALTDVPDDVTFLKTGQATLVAQQAAFSATLASGLAAIAAALGASAGGGGGAGGSVAQTGASADYHAFDDVDTDRGSVLNGSGGDVIKVYAGENRNGLGWNLPGVRLGTVNTAQVVITPAFDGQDEPDLSGVTLNLVQDGERLLVRWDWPRPLTDAMLPQGKWYISISYTLDGSTDNTSRLLVVRQ